MVIRRLLQEFFLTSVYGVCIQVHTLIITKMSSVGDNSSTPAPENDNFIGDLRNEVQEALGPNIDITDLPKYHWTTTSCWKAIHQRGRLEFICLLVVYC